MFKKTLITLSLISGSAFAASPSSEMQVNANIDSGCILSGTDIQFNTFTYGISNTANGSFDIKCSKTSRVSISASSLHGDSAADYPLHRLLLNNDVANKDITRNQLRYFLRTQMPSDKFGVSITTPDSGTFANSGSRTNIHITFTTSRIVTMPVIATTIPQHTNTIGDYSDSLTYTATF